MADVANDAAMISTHTADSIMASCLECADELKDKTAATVAATAANRQPPKPGFGSTPLLKGAELTEKLEEYLIKKEVEDTTQTMQTTRRKINRFDSPNAPERERWKRLVRMLDGKASLKYLSSHTGTNYEKRRGDLARRMFEKDTIPDEIKNYVKTFKDLVFTE